MTTNSIFVAETGDFVVIDKPSSYPMHPCGAFRYNSVLQILEMGILELENKLSCDPLHIVHRLDRYVKEYYNKTLATVFGINFSSTIIIKE